MSEPIYKIAGRTEWTRAGAQGAYSGSEVDHRDGFIHLSSASQVRETATKHFAGRDDLVLLCVDPERCPVGALRWEPSRGGALFPHLYAPLPTSAVVRVDDLPLEGSAHRFPPDLTDRPGDAPG